MNFPDDRLPPDVFPEGEPLPPPINLSTRLAYGAGDLGPAITANVLAFFSLVFFTNVAGINAAVAGSILLIGKIWDAVNDPIVGVLSDRTQSAKGRRYPWMLFGAIPFGITFFLLWLVPQFSNNPATNQQALFWYYVIMSILFNSFYTMVNLPYTALTAELTQDYNERTRLSSYRFAFSIGGSIFSLILALVIFQIFPNPQQQYLILGGICAIISTLPLYWCVFGTMARSRAVGCLDESETLEAQNLDVAADVLPHWLQNGLTARMGQQWRRKGWLVNFLVTITNVPFLYVIGIYLFSWLAVQVTASILPYYVVDALKMPQASFTVIALIVQATALVLLFFWQRVSDRYGKKATYFMGMVLWVIAQGFLFTLQSEQVFLVYGLAVLAGAGVSIAYLIPWSMIPDVIELDELRTGQRREGIFYSFMVLLQKVGLAVGLFLVGQSLDRAGFLPTTPGQAPPVQPETAIQAIRLAIGPFPTVALIFGMVLAYFYPITKEKHAEIMLRLHERNKQKKSG
ncbi:MFS transporter [Leptolyngbya ohadii]|uniref:MFS transporter n=1 Tax=Leptolyngbya ohadii TaxID=1962290 RepID=UPI000B5A0871|nr:MFS transporter [Leptolyngbya ohadii]